MTEDELLTMFAKIATLLVIDGQWSARAQGSNTFHKAACPIEAMRLATGQAQPTVPVQEDDDW